MRALLMVKGQINGKDKEVLCAELELPSEPMSLDEFNRYMKLMSDSVARQLALAGRIK